MFIHKLIPIAIAASLFAAGPAVAQAKPVELDSDVKLVRVVDDGLEKRKELVAPDGVLPGDVLLFTTKFHNGGTDPVTNFVVINPVPTSVVLTEDSANELDVSVNGGVAWGLLEQLTIADEDGNPRPAMPDDITHIRWTIERLSAGESGQASYAATVR